MNVGLARAMAPVGEKCAHGVVAVTPWPDEASDEALLTALAAGEKDALTILFSRHRMIVFRVGMKVLRDGGEAEDLTQHVFFEIFRHASQFDPEKGSAKSWILAIAYTRSVNHREALLRRSFYRWEPFDDRAHSFANYEDITRQIERRELGRRARLSLAVLNETQRKIIHRVCFEGWSLREIATETGESFANVRHRYYRGLRKMRALVSAAEG